LGKSLFNDLDLAIVLVLRVILKYLPSLLSGLDLLDDAVV
jgi:hypothetical protein